jgi:hypothetical protein
MLTASSLAYPAYGRWAVRTAVTILGAVRDLLPKPKLVVALAAALCAVGLGLAQLCAPAQAVAPASAKIQERTALACIPSQKNQVLDAPVRLEGGAFFSGGWPGGSLAKPQSVVNGKFLPEGQQWNQGPVWWDETSGGDHAIVIERSTAFTIRRLVLQADNNDEYVVGYWDSTQQAWMLLWTAPPMAGAGMRTREFNTCEHPVTTPGLVIQGQRGDRLYSVSEIQAFS